MHPLLETADTIAPGMGFSLFDKTHLLWLVAFLVLTFGSCILYRRLKDRGRRIMLGILAGVLVADELFKYVVLLLGGNWHPAYLPLHLCSVNIFVIALHAVRPGQLLENFLYTICMPAALAALLFPGWSQLPFPNLLHIHSFTAHIILAMYPMVLLAGGFRPEIWYVPKCLGLLILLAIPGLIANLTLDCNFMFLMWAPKGNPLRWFGDLWGNHLLGYPVLITAIVAVLHVPWWLWVRYGKNSENKKGLL